MSAAGSYMINIFMKIFEVLMTLLEYDRATTANKLGPKLIQANQRDRVADLDKILEVLEACDPTRTKQYMMWIARQYIAGAFRLEDRPRVFDALTAFESLKRRLTQKDINQYTLSTLRQVIDDATTVGELGSAQAQTNAAGGFPVVPDSKVLYNGPLGQLSIPETEAASIALGKNTSWCTARKDSENQFDYYSSLSELYVWIDQRGKKYQFWFGNEDEEPQIKDSKDDNIPAAKLKQLVDSSPPLTKLINSKLKDPKVAVYWAENVIRGRWPEAESIIAQDLLAAFDYAQNVIKGRWAEGEKAIAQNPQAAFDYAYQVINGRWPEAESIIAQDPQAAFNYARLVIEGRWPKAESIIAQNPRAAFNYAYYVIKGRWPEAESIIAQDPLVAFNYARLVIKGRWPEAESIIAQDPQAAFDYARLVIKGRWPEAEESISKNPKLSIPYAYQVIKGRWPEAESIIAQNPKSAEWYADQVIKGRWPEGEKAIAQNPYTAYNYAYQVIKGRWPEAESIIAQNPYTAAMYKKNFGINLRQ
jgi:hypothetical protein